METGCGSLHSHRTGPHTGSRPTETVPVGWPPFRGGEACYHLTTPRTSTGPISCNQTHTCTFNPTIDDCHSAALTTPGPQPPGRPNPCLQIPALLGDRAPRPPQPRAGAGDPPECRKGSKNGSHTARLHSPPSSWWRPSWGAALLTLPAEERHGGWQSELKRENRPTAAKQRSLGLHTLLYSPHSRPAARRQGTATLNPPPRGTWYVPSTARGADEEPGPGPGHGHGAAARGSRERAPGAAGPLPAANPAGPCWKRPSSSSLWGGTF